MTILEVHCTKFQTVFSAKLLRVNLEAGPGGRLWKEKVRKKRKEARRWNILALTQQNPLAVIRSTLKSVLVQLSKNLQRSPMSKQVHLAPHEILAGLPLQGNAIEKQNLATF